MGGRIRFRGSEARSRVHRDVGTVWIYPEADEIAESGLGRLHLRIKLRTWGASRTHEAIREIVWEFDRP